MAPSVPPVPLTQHVQSLNIGTVPVPKTRVKKEDDIDPFPSAFDEDNDLGSIAHNAQTDEDMDNREESNVDTHPHISIKEEESSNEDSFQEDAAQETCSDEDPENAEEQSDEDDADEEGVDEMGTELLSSDVPMPSIEEDGRHNEEEEQFRPRKRPTFLHGRTHRPDHAPASTSADGGAGDFEDEDFEEELSGEREDGLLINDSDLRYWIHHKRSTTGIQEWPTEARRLYKLLFLRGLFPMFGSQWTWDFPDHPMPGELFTPLDSDDKSLLKAEKSEFYGT